MASKLATAYVEVTADATKLENEMSDVRSSVMKETRALASAIGSLGIGAAAAALVKNTVGMASAAEQTAAAYEIILKDQEQAKKLLGDIETLSVKTPFEPGELKQGGRALLAFGATADEIVPSLRLLGDLAAGSGSQIQEIIRVFNKTRSVGKLTGETFEQFAERGINLQDEITDMLGISGEQFVEMRGKGEISFGLVQKAMQRMTSQGGMFFGAMEAQAATFGGMMSTITGNIKLLAVQMGQSLLPAFKAAARVVISFLDGLLALNDATGGFVAMSAAATTAITGLTAALWGAYVAMKALGLSFRSLVLSLGPIGLAIIAVGALAGGIITLIKAIASSKAVVAAWEENAAKLGMAWDAFKTGMANTWEAIKGIIMNALQAIANVFGVNLEMLKSDTANFVAGLIGAFADWVLNVSEWLQVLTQNWGLTWELLKATAVVALVGLKDLVLQFPKWWAYSMGLILGLVVDAMTSILKFVATVVVKIGSLMLQMLKAVWAGIKNLFFGGSFSEAFTGAAKQVLDSGMQMGEAFKAGWDRSNPWDLWESSEGLKKAKAAQQQIIDQLAKDKRAIEAMRQQGTDEAEAAKQEDEEKKPPPQEVIHKLDAGFFAFGDIQRKMQENQFKSKKDSEKLVKQGEIAETQRRQQNKILTDIRDKPTAEIANG